MVYNISLNNTFLKKTARKLLVRKWLKLLTLLLSVALTDAVKATDSKKLSVVLTDAVKATDTN